MSKGRICCRPGLNNGAFLAPCNSSQKVWHSRLDEWPQRRLLLVTAANTERSAPLFSRGLRRTEALRHICMFSHCCINFRLEHWWCVAYLCSAHTSTHLQYPKITDMFVSGEKRLIYSAEKRGGLGWVHHCPQNGILVFDTHTVDSKQPWTNGNSGFFSHYVFYFYGMKGNTNCNLKKGLWDNYFFGLCL